MDYEKKYKETIAWIDIIMPTLTKEQQEDALENFPELQESEDERIRKEILGFLKTNNAWNKEWIDWLEKQDNPQDKGEISDGYHTFNELYYYRMLYNAAFFNMLPKEWVHKSKRHNDGEECFGGGWFIVMANLPTGQISNHYELKDWDLFQIPEKEVADKWDGHTPQEAADRLHKYLLEKQSEQKPFDYESANIQQKDFAPKPQRMVSAEAKEALYVTIDDELARKMAEEYRNFRENCGVNDPVMLNEIEAAYYEGVISRKPIERKEEDEWYIDEIIKVVNSNTTLYRNQEIVDFKNNLTDWLKHLKDRVQPQSKEWSEEDEKMANDLIEGYTSSEKIHHLAHTSKEIADWLKSLKKE